MSKETIEKLDAVQNGLSKIMKAILKSHKDEVTELLEATVDFDNYTECRVNLSTGYTFTNADGDKYIFSISIGEPKEE